MHHIRTSDLWEFYGTARGKMARRILRKHIREMWPDTAGMRVLGFGYAAPYFRPFLNEAERAVVLMPEAQGAMFWPPEGGGHVALSSQGEWPIETDSVDRLLVIHGFSGPESLDPVLREAFRVLTGQGRMIVVVPNRAGLWARFDATPFGMGTPYSMGQLCALLKSHSFVVERQRHALFVPPFSSRLMLSTAKAWEEAGMRFFGAFGGVNIVEASRQLYAGITAGNAPAVSTGYRRRVVSVPEVAPRTRRG